MIDLWRRYWAWADRVAGDIVAPLEQWLIRKGEQAERYARQRAEGARE